MLAAAARTMMVQAATITHWSINCSITSWRQMMSTFNTMFMQSWGQSQPMERLQSIAINATKGYWIWI